MIVDVLFVEPLSDSSDGVDALTAPTAVSADADTVAFRWKDYRIKRGDRMKVMRLATGEFIRRFLLHVLPRGFHRIRHYGLLAGSARKANLALARELLDVAVQPDPGDLDEPEAFRPPCSCCGGRMIVIETFERWRQPRGPPHGSKTNRETAP